MNQIARQLAFMLVGTLLRIPILAVLKILGQFDLFKVVFLVYPADTSELKGFCPAIPVLKRFFSGRPTFGGLILDGMKPIGLYMVVPNTVPELARRENRELSLTIVHRLFRMARLVNARSVGLAGQLSFIFQRKHRIPIVAPLYSSLYGSVFSLSETIDKVIQSHMVSGKSGPEGKKPIIGILGRGEISDLLARHITDTCQIDPVYIDVKYLKSGQIALKNVSEAKPHLNSLNLIVNMMPTGDHFLQTKCYQHLAEECLIVDFSHPGIDSCILSHRKHMGNRIEKPGLRFYPSLPGDWEYHTLPACSLASLLASEEDPQWKNFDEFCCHAKKRGFFVPF